MRAKASVAFHQGNYKEPTIHIPSRKAKLRFGKHLQY